MKYNGIINKSIYHSMNTTMCTFMIDFIQRIKTGMYMHDMMNIVLEHLGIFQVNILCVFLSVEILYSYCLDNCNERHK